MSTLCSSRGLPHAVHAMMAANDIITGAFITALRTHQQDHGQEPTYDLQDWMKLEAEAASSLQEEQQQEMQTEHGVTGYSVPLAQDATAQDQQLRDHQQAHAQHQQQGEQQLQHMQLAHEDSAKQNNNLGHVKIRYTREQLMQLQQQQQQHTVQLSGSAALPSSTATPQTPSAVQPDHLYVRYQQDEQYYQHQQQHYHQQQQQWYPQYSWGSYPYWNQGWGTAAGGGDNWSWGGQHSATSAQQRYMPPPPPAPPVPPVIGRFGADAGQQAKACSACGKYNMHGAADAAAPRDQESVTTALLSQVPRDVAAVPQSLAAAEAAIVKAAVLSQSAECRSNMPELMMAWFYAGYHAGKISTGCGSSSSSGTHQQQVPAADVAVEAVAAM